MYTSELLKEDNRVIIRVWTSEDNKDFPGHNVGHVSIQTQTPATYMSLWPIPFTMAQREEYRAAGTLEQQYLRYFGERDADFHQTYDDDFIAEGRVAPQVTVCLYGLNADMAENEFYKLTRSTTHWRLVGRNLFVQKLEKAAEAVVFGAVAVESSVGKRSVDSCASLALEVLKAGEIGKLLSTAEYSSVSSRTSSVVSPDDILKVVIPAKLREVTKHPETRGFVYGSETSVETLRRGHSDDAAPSRCAIM